MPAMTSPVRSEFDLIHRFFTRPAKTAALGVGDDCALLAPPPGEQLALSTDMLVAERHFFADCAPQKLGHKTLAVNLSDLAAMGAQPRAFLLALALPNADADWLQPFANGLFALADAFDCELIGGDTTQGPLNLAVTVIGSVPPGQALRRDGARPGDDVWVSGTLGDARLALGALRGEWTLPVEMLTAARRQLEMPMPQVQLGLALRGLATAAIDVSDGLLGDLRHLLDASRCGATINADALPLSAELAQQPRARQLQCALAGGDDYQLCFTAAVAARAQIAALGNRLALPLTRIGTITADGKQTVTDAAGAPVPGDFTSFDHFAS